MSSLPPFIERPGEIVLRHPIELKNTKMFVFLLEADRNKLQALCDRVLNDPSGGAVYYKPLLPVVAVVCADLPEGRSMDPVHSGWGWSTEKDFGFWVPLVGGATDGTDEEHLVWFLPYLFVDNIAAVATGRETFGFTKFCSDLKMPTSKTDPAEFTVDTLTIKTFSNTTEASVDRLYRVFRTGGGLLGDLNDAWNNAVGAFDSMKGELIKFVADAGVTNAMDLVLSLSDVVRTQSLQMVFLKQFRDVDDPTKACHQQIVEVPSKLVQWSGGGPVLGYEIEIQSFASHPIVDDLGLSGPNPKPFLSFWTKFDFELDRGRVVWSAM